MQTIVNKTFKEIAVGNAATVQRTLQAGDVRAWAGAFGEVDMLAGPDQSQGADSTVSVWVIPTNEELMIAQHTLALVRP